MQKYVKGYELTILIYEIKHRNSRVSSVLVFEPLQGLLTKLIETHELKRMHNQKYDLLRKRIVKRLS